MRAEAEEGLSRGSLVPILFDPVRPPLAFRRIQTKDVTDGLTTEIQGDLVAAITRVIGTPGTSAVGSQYDSVADHEQEVRYTMSADDVRIAWAQTGEGPPIVRVINWASNLETEWSEPGTRRFIDMLSESFKLIRYNGRGSGLSETRPEFTYSFDERYSDLEAVMSACAEKRVIVFGISEGAPAAVAWAAQNPERTSYLVLLGAANVHPVDEDVLADREWLFRMVEAIPLLAREQSLVVAGLQAIGQQLPISILGIVSPLMSLLTP